MIAICIWVNLQKHFGNICSLELNYVPQSRFQNLHCVQNQLDHKEKQLFEACSGFFFWAQTTSHSRNLLRLWNSGFRQFSFGSYPIENGFLVTVCKMSLEDQIWQICYVMLPSNSDKLNLWGNKQWFFNCLWSRNIIQHIVWFLAIGYPSKSVKNVINSRFSVKFSSILDKIKG